MTEPGRHTARAIHNEILLDTGVRSRELVSIRLNDVLLNQHRVRVPQGKSIGHSVGDSVLTQRHRHDTAGTSA